MNFDLALQKHAEWKSRLRSALYAREKLDAAQISKDNVCEIGAWLHGEAKVQFGQHSTFQHCVEEHAAFHREAGKVATAINEGKSAEAENMLAMGSAYAEASKRVGVAIIELKMQIK